VIGLVGGFSVAQRAVVDFLGSIGHSPEGSHLVESIFRFTITDLACRPERLDDTRYALIDGDLLVAYQPRWDHPSAGLALGAALPAWSRQTRLGTPNVAPGLIFSPEDDVAPDLLWISQARLARGYATMASSTQRRNGWSQSCRPAARTSATTAN
jgi:hypothetical protein